MRFWGRNPAEAPEKEGETILPRPVYRYGGMPILVNAFFFWIRMRSCRRLKLLKAFRPKPRFAVCFFLLLAVCFFLLLYEAKIFNRMEAGAVCEMRPVFRAKGIGCIPNRKIDDKNRKRCFKRMVLVFSEGRGRFVCRQKCFRRRWPSLS